jgi:GNAT superfamily N-acetyltransferase
MSDPEIRIATIDDLTRVRALVLAFRDHLRARVPSDVELDTELPAALSDPSIELACAWVEGEAVGYTQTRFFRSLWAPGTEALFEDLFVLRPFRSRSVGRSLLRHALRRANERGARLFGLNTNDRNAAAQALYRAEGLLPQTAEIWADGREVRWVARLEPRR